MKTAAVILALTAGFAATAPTPDQEHRLQKRLGPLAVAIIGGSVATGTVGTASIVAGNQINEFIADIQDWEKVREEFTQRTVEEMWAKRPGDEYAAICYNMGYSVSKPDQVSEQASMEIKSGVLNTDYDCFFLKGPDNTFTPEGDGGFINFAAQHNDAYCTYDDASGEIYCK